MTLLADRDELDEMTKTAGQIWKRKIVCRNEVIFKKPANTASSNTLDFTQTSCIQMTIGL
jgi:hypothetical protein